MTWRWLKVRILNKDYFIFENYFITAIEHFFRGYVASYKHSECWENSRKLCKPSTTSRF